MLIYVFKTTYLKGIVIYLADAQLYTALTSCWVVPAWYTYVIDAHRLEYLIYLYGITKGCRGTMANSD